MNDRKGAIIFMKMFKFFLIVLILSVGSSVFGFSYTSSTNSTGVGIPKKVTHIEFYNGGTCIASYDNAQVEIFIETRDKFFKLREGNAKTTFITYKVSLPGKVPVYIVDSESLCILYTVE